MKFEFKRDFLLINLVVLIEIIVLMFSSYDVLHFTRYGVKLYPILTPLIDFLRIVLGFPFLLFFPGYALLSALFPRRDDLDTVERIALSIGLSIAIVPIVGIILHFTPYGIRLSSILFSITGLVLLFSIVAIRRRRRIGETYVFTFEIKWKDLPQGEKTYRFIALLLVLMLFVMIVQAMTVPRIERFTEFYILDSEGKAENYSENLTFGENVELIVGIKNHEATDVEYKVVILLDNETLKTIDGIRLRHEERWEEKVNFVPIKKGENMKLEFLLHKEDNNKVEPYRTLRLIVNIT
jgi:uncharacterized membrane protein